MRFLLQPNGSVLHDSLLDYYNSNVEAFSTVVYGWAQGLLYHGSDDGLGEVFQCTSDYALSDVHSDYALSDVH